MDPVIHFEMPFKDKKRVQTFYQKAFDWKTTELSDDHYINAATSKTDKRGLSITKGAINGGFFSIKDCPGFQPNIVISVKDMKKSILLVKKAGGKITLEPFEIKGYGLYASFTDPEGNRVSMMQMYPAKAAKKKAVKKR